MPVRDFDGVDGGGYKGVADAHGHPRTVQHAYLEAEGGQQPPQQVGQACASQDLVHQLPRLGHTYTYNYAYNYNVK